VGAVDGVQGFVAPVDDVERVQADPGVRGLLAGHGQIDAARVHADRLQRGGAGAQRGEELAERFFVALLTNPDHPPGVVVGHDGQELAAAPVGDLVHPDAVQVV
jgi:hypothetical protein